MSTASCAHIRRRCKAEGWTAKKKVGEQWVEDYRFTPKTLNLYGANEYFIMPASKPRQCAYVELVAVGAQKPRWFCSHWWGEPVLDFVACVKTHAMDHGYDDAAAYWVCAYVPQLPSNPSLARAKGRS